MISELANRVFVQAIEDYHRYDQIDHPIENPYPSEMLEHLLYRKCWIDTMQWHMEDVVRNPEIVPQQALMWKRRIDKSNQDRTDMVEYIDSYFLDKYAAVQPLNSATVNTESPAWAVDRLSILALKIYHMQQESVRESSDAAHRESCLQKLRVLEEQRTDLSTSIDQLLLDIEAGVKKMKVYKQMKMYNDPSLNPVLYASNK